MTADALLDTKAGAFSYAFAASQPPERSSSDLDRRLWAFSARQAQRLNASSIPQQEIDSLLGERQRLLDKKFDDVMSKAEEARLEYVEWSLDRIEDAQTGGVLDLLESRILEMEDFVESVRDLKQQIASVSQKK